MPNDEADESPTLEEPIIGMPTSKMRELLYLLGEARNPTVRFSPDFSVMQADAIKGKDNRIDDALRLLDGYKWLTQ